jgi:uncharacterized protein
MEKGKGGMRAFKIIPRAPRDEISGLRGEEVVIRLKAPPVDGKANEALISFLSKALSCPMSSIEIARGGTGRRKLLRLSEAAIKALDGVLALL